MVDCIYSGGRLPTEIGLLSKLRKLCFGFSKICKEQDSRYCAKGVLSLSAADMSAGRRFGGTIPTEIGLATNLGASLESLILMFLFVPVILILCCQSCYTWQTSILAGPSPHKWGHCRNSVS